MKKFGLVMLSLLAFVGIGFGTVASVNNRVEPVCAETEVIDSTAEETEIDEKLIETIVEKVRNRDWENLFTVENVVAIVGWILDGGLIIWCIRTIVKNKALKTTLERTCKETVAAVVPKETRDIVTTEIGNAIKPLFIQTQADIVTLKDAMGVFCKVLALMQGGKENAPLIIDELAKLNITDKTALEDVKKYIDEMFREHEEAIKASLESLNKIKDEGMKVIETVTKEEPVAEVKVKKDNGTQI